MADNNEIEIPEPVNRPKSEDKQRAEHPQEKKSTGNTQKIGTPVQSRPKSSRFEPAPVSVELPSHGFLYKGKVNDSEVAEGIVRIRPMTLNDEKILTTDRLVRQGKALDMLLESTIKSDIDPYDLLSNDRMYLLFYLRGMSYGLDYEFDVKCYHCGHNFTQTIEIDKLPVKEWETKDEAVEPVVIELPMSGATVEAHFMRGHEEQKMTQAEQESRSFDEPDDSSSNTILYLVDKVTLPDGEVLTPHDKDDFLSNLIAADIDTIRETLGDRAPGIKQLDHIKCPRCGGHLEFNVPLGRNFFRRSRQR